MAGRGRRRPADAASVTVDVAGKVRRPGIVVLDAGARVVDALEAAGGARPGVDLSGLNLARVLVDGEQIWSACRAAGRRGRGGGRRRPASPGGPLVNLNTADPGRARDAARGGAGDRRRRSWPGATEHGGFTAVDELLEVDGIGDATLAKIAPHVTV